MKSSTLSRLRAGAVVIAIGVLSVGCAEKQKPQARPKATPAGFGVLVTDPIVRVAAGTTCPEGVAAGVGERFKSSATGALTNAGFAIVSAPGSEAFTANLELEVNYCSDAGIVSGSTAFDLKRASGASVWRGQATGDQARAETADSTIAELFETMLFDERVIEATKGSRS